jgi:dTDP-4-dehydrorhamnose reductase
MRVLVAGATGQVATCLRLLSEQRGHPGVTCVGRPELDLELPETHARILNGYDVIVNAAAYTDVEKAEDEPEKAFAINATGAGALARAAKVAGAHFIHLSTDYVYSGDKPSPYDETDATGPISAYGRSKLEGERLVLAAHDDAIILRTAWVYSPFGKNFLLTMLRLMKTRDELSVVHDQIGCPTSAWDIADAILRIAETITKGHKANGIFHLAGQGETSWHGFAITIRDLVAEKTGRHVVVKTIDTSAYPTKAKRPKNSRLNTQKLASEFGIALPRWEASLQQCFAQIQVGSTE